MELLRVPELTHNILSSQVKKKQTRKTEYLFYFASFYYLPARVLKGISPGKETPGRYVIVQINKGPTFLNLKEVKAFGREAEEEPQNPEATKNLPGGLGFALTTALNEMKQKQNA